MSDLKLTLACWDYDRTRPLIDGRVKPEGIDLDVEVLRPRQTFQRMLDNKEFEVSELSLASYTALKGRGDCPFVAVPVALSKMFRHSCIYVGTGAGIHTPQDLKGKRVGLPEYQLTACVWARIILEDDHGVKPSDMVWVRGGIETPGRPEKISIKLPEGATTIVVGNPLIADVSVQAGGLVVVTGKGYGTTNLVALDRTGATLMERELQVRGGGEVSKAQLLAGKPAPLVRQMANVAHVVAQVGADCAQDVDPLEFTLLAEIVFHDRRVQDGLLVGAW